MAPPGAVRTLGTATRFLVAALMLGAVALVFRLRAAQGEARMEELTELAGPTGEGSGTSCQPVVACGPLIIDDIPTVPVVDRSTACRNAAYLCDGLALRGERARALRWGDRQPPIQVLVRWPDNVANDNGMNARHQQGAVRGLRAWTGLPIALAVEAEPQPTDDNPWTDTPASDRRPVVRGGARTTGRAPAQRDFEVQWQIAPHGAELGEGYTTWGSGARAGGFGTRVTSLRLPRARSARGEYLSDRDIEAVAAHTMGHILGLPHSSSSKDVMYPGNTARTPSADDRRAVHALYALPNGAEIRSEP